MVGGVVVDALRLAFQARRLRQWAEKGRNPKSSTNARCWGLERALPPAFREKEGSIGGGRGGWLKVETPKTSAHLWNFKGSARNGEQLVDRKTNGKGRHTLYTGPLSLSLPLPSPSCSPLPFFPWLCRLR